MFPLKVVTLHGVVYEDDVERVTIPTAAGVITVLEKHEPLVSVLMAGEMTIQKKDNPEQNFAISHGILEVRSTGEVFIMADTAERAEHIDIDRAEAARARAEELMKQEQAVQDVDFARMQAKIEKELARIHVGNRYRKLVGK